MATVHFCITKAVSSSNYWYQTDWLSKNEIIQEIFYQNMSYLVSMKSLKIDPAFANKIQSIVVVLNHIFLRHKIALFYCLWRDLEPQMSNSISKYNSLTLRCQEKTNPFRPFLESMSLLI